VSPLARAAVWLVRLYREAISPRSLPSCRYLPTCSEYALDAVTTHGALRGGWLALRRLLRCHPLHAGGYDPVPPARRPAATGPLVRDAG
jgi:uncharacterized protein